MDVCQKCGEDVSERFVDVFGIDGEVHGCLDCSSRSELHGGGAARRQ